MSSAEEKPTTRMGELNENSIAPKEQPAPELAAPESDAKAADCAIAEPEAENVEVQKDEANQINVQEPPLALPADVVTGEAGKDSQCVQPEGNLTAPEAAPAAGPSSPTQPIAGTSGPTADPTAKMTHAQRQHHLLKHVLPEEQRGNNALHHFGTNDIPEAVTKIHGMVQRELQVHFAKVYGVKSNSNNNSWLRKKLLEAIAPKHMWDLHKHGRDPKSQASKRSAAEAALQEQRAKRLAAAGVAAATAAYRDTNQPEFFNADTQRYSQWLETSAAGDGKATQQGGATATAVWNTVPQQLTQQQHAVAVANGSRHPGSGNTTDLMVALISLHGLLNTQKADGTGNGNGVGSSIGAAMPPPPVAAALQAQAQPQAVAPPPVTFGSFGGQRPGSSFVPQPTMPAPAPPPQQQARGYEYDTHHMFGGNINAVTTTTDHQLSGVPGFQSFQAPPPQRHDQPSRITPTAVQQPQPTRVVTDQRQQVASNNVKGNNNGGVPEGGYIVPGSNYQASSLLMSLLRRHVADNNSN